MEKKENIETKDDVKPKGRAAVLAAYKETNPDAEGEPDDESLYDFAHNRHAETEGKYNELAGANSRLAELVKNDPKLGSVLSMISGDEPKSFPYSVARVYGKEPFELEGDALEEFEAGYKEHLQELAKNAQLREQAGKNVEETYVPNMEKYAADNSLSEEKVAQLNEGFIKLADDIVTGNISYELIDFAYKGLNYDKDVEEAADTGEVEGRNSAIEAKMKEKTGSNNPLPDLGAGTGAGKLKPAAPGGSGFFRGFPGKRPNG